MTENADRRYGGSNHAVSFFSSGLKSSQPLFSDDQAPMDKASKKSGIKPYRNWFQESSRKHLEIAEISGMLNHKSGYWY
jgi:hypothetical protein